MGSITDNTLFLAICLLGSYCHGLGNLEPPAENPGLKDYSIEIQKIEMLMTSTGHFGPDSIIFTTMYNDTTRAAAGILNFVKDFPENVMMSTILHKYNKNNKYIALVEQKETLCDYVKKQQFIFEPVFDNGNLSRQCPPKAGINYFERVVVDTLEFPPHVEEHTWLMLFDITLDDVSMMKFHAIVKTLQSDD